MQRRSRNQQGSALQGEFAAALTIFFLVILFPLINLIGVATGAGTLYFMTTQGASSAGTSATYGMALDAMEATINTIRTGGLGQFAKLAPVGGYSGTGANLFVIVTPTSGGMSTYYGPNSPYVAVLDTENNIYEYQVKTTYDVGPFLDLSMLPFVGNVPGIGAPMRLEYVAHSYIEGIDGLAQGGDGTDAGGGDPAPGGDPGGPAGSEPGGPTDGGGADPSPPPPDGGGTPSPGDVPTLPTDGPAPGG